MNTDCYTSKRTTTPRRKALKIMAFSRRLDNAARNVDGRPPFSLIEKWEREEKMKKVTVVTSEPAPEVNVYLPETPTVH